jgi:hypothetical protein
MHVDDLVFFAPAVGAVGDAEHLLGWCYTSHIAVNLGLFWSILINLLFILDNICT